MAENFSVWSDAPGHPYIKRSGAKFRCTACDKSGTGHQYPRHCATVQHRGRVRALERAQAVVLGYASAAAAAGAGHAAAAVAVAAGMPRATFTASMSPAAVVASPSKTELDGTPLLRTATT
jgi:hypothetical protein